MTAFGCAEGVDMSPTGTTDQEASANGVPKALFSHWVDNGGLVAIDFSQGAFDMTKPFSIATITQQGCTCQVLTQGNASAGTMQVSSCAGNFSNGTQTCADFNGTAQYTLTNNTLTFCQQALGCREFR